MSFEDLAGEITAAWHARNEPDGLTPEIAKRVEEAIDLLIAVRPASPRWSTGKLSSTAG